MRVVVPVLASEALDHVQLLLVDRLLVVGQVAVAVQIKVIPVVLVVAVGIFFFVGQLATFWHLAIPAIATEIQLRVELVHLVGLVAGQHAPEAEAMWLYPVLGADLVIIDLLQKGLLICFLKVLEFLCLFKKWVS